MPNRMSMPERTLQSVGHVTSGVIGLRTVMANLYAVSNADGSWVLVDTGLPFNMNRILRWIERRKSGSRPKAIVLTHGHFDHVGNVKELARHWDVPVYAHPLEKPYLTGKSKYPPPDPMVGRGVFSLFAPIYPRGPINLGDRLRELPPDGSVPDLEGWRWIATPGHSPGHVSFYREKDGMLLAGDAFATTKQESFFAVATQRPEIQGPPAYYTMNWDDARESVRTLATLRPKIAACGHGLPIAGPEVPGALDFLAANFDQVARPAQGRYVHEPAIANENGVVHLPPPLVNPAVKIAVGVALAGGLVYGFTRARRS